MLAKFGIALSSSAEDGTLGTFLSGTFLRGTVWARIDRPIRGGDIRLVVKGQESTVVNHSGGKSTSKQKRVFLNAAVTINTHQFVRGEGVPSGDREWIQPGNYEFPFAYGLRANLPSSMALRRGRDSFSIQYEVSATLKGSGIFYDYSCKQAFFVRRRPTGPNRSLPCFVEPKVFPIASWCFPRGSISLGAAMENTLLCKGDTAYVGLACRTYTDCPAREVSVKLVQRCQWSAENHNESKTQSLCKGSVRVEEILHGAKSGVIRGDSVRNELADLRHELQDGPHIIRFRLPRGTLPSYQSTLIHVAHYVEVNIGMEQVCVTNPILRIPVQCLDVSSFEQGMRDETPHHANTIPRPSAPIQDVSIAAPTTIPVAQAIPEDFYENSIRCEEIIMPSDMVPLPNSNRGADVVSATAELITPTVDSLLVAMSTAYRDLELLQTLTEQPEWQPVLSKLTPSDFGRIVGSIQSDFDQPTAAELLAIHCNNGITCFHVVAVMETCGKWNRVNILGRLIEHCVDVSENHSLLLSTLDEWDRIAARSVVAGALEKTSGQTIEL